jgi:hypothetical protein
MRDVDQHLTADRRSRRSGHDDDPCLLFCNTRWAEVLYRLKIRRDQRQIVNDDESHRSLAVSR